MKKKNILEVCAGSYMSALAAYKGGANRIELCCALNSGGLTPSLGTITETLRIPNLIKHILIRPREGDFFYSEEEKRVMLADIEWIRSKGADGIAVGALRSDGTVDVPFIKDCVKAAVGMNVTFHRAFDLCVNPLAALSDIINCGCSRLLTSGQAETAEKGIALLKKLVDYAANEIIIMPGCGVSSKNAKRILNETGATEIHASARCMVKSQMRTYSNGVIKGIHTNEEFSIEETSSDEVRSIVTEINE